MHEPLLELSVRFSMGEILSDDLPEAATALDGVMNVLIPISGLIDKAAESARLEKEIAKLCKETERGAAKLSNADFLGRAPAEVVEKERTRVTELVKGWLLGYLLRLTHTAQKQEMSASLSWCGMHLTTRRVLRTGWPSSFIA